MQPNVNIKDGTCDARFLAAAFDMTPRNISHLIDRGMPIFKRGKAGKGHVFKFSHAAYWYAGWCACKKWDKPIPGTLETALTGFAIGQDNFNDFSVTGWVKDAEKLAADMGFSHDQFDLALQYVIVHGLVGWQTALTSSNHYVIKAL